MADALWLRGQKRHGSRASPLTSATAVTPSPHLAPQPPVPSQDVARRIHRAWWVRFTFNGITCYERSAYGLVGGVAEGFCAAVGAEPMPSAKSCCSCAANASMPSECSAARR